MRIETIAELALGAAVLLTLVACGGGADCPEGFYPIGDGACAPVDEDEDDEDDSDDSDDGDDGARIGEVCQEDDDCARSLFCLFESGYDSIGICTETCSSWADCSEAFWECCDVGGAGSACVPDDWVDRAPSAACD